MAHPLDEAHAKVSRARTHLEELQRKAASFADIHPYRVDVEQHADTGRIEFIARAVGKEEPVPVEIGIIAGDIAHNLRSALNYLTWRLGNPPVGTGPGDSTQFPIYFDQPGRTYKKSPAARFRDGENGYLQGVAKAHRATIERLQPYHGGRRQHLAFLAGLSNRDKHQVVTTTLMLGHIEPPEMPVGRAAGTEIFLYPTADVRDGAVVGYVTGLVADVDPYVDMKFRPTFEVGFGDNPMIGSAANFDRLAQFVALILRVFRDVF